jgi:hypothetical protein
MNQAKISKTVFIQIRGGLGNQLFCYFAGEFLNSDSNVQVKYIYNAKSNRHDKSNSKIYSFDLQSDFIISNSFKFYFIAIKLILKTPITSIRKILNKFMTQNSKVHILFDDIYDEKFTGFQKESEAIKIWLFNSKSRVFYLRGLFQDFVYFDNQPRKELSLKTPSIWYQQFSEESRAIKPIILHVRLGDYLKEIESHLGVLSVEYYQNALNLLREKYPNNEVWVFSNQTAKAKILLTPIIDSSFKFIYEAESKDPAEVLLAMSSGQALIVSNSTFSLWSAKISPDLNSIVIPEPFFKALPFYSENFLESWSKSNSKWLTQEDINKLL